MRQIYFATFLAFLLLPTVGLTQVKYISEIKSTSKALYSSFNTLQLRQAVFAMTDTARTYWANLPVGLKARVGVSIGNMTDEQRKQVHRILSAALSSQGYLKATGIMHLDDLLNRYHDSLYYKKVYNDSIYNRIKSLLWTHRNFYFAFFNTPKDSLWGFKFEGHHLSLNFTIADNKISVSPFFIGTDPAEYPNTEYAGWRVLGQEQDLGLKLLSILTPEQKKKATLSTDVPRDIFTNPDSKTRLVNKWGLKGKEMNIEQKEILEYIIREYVFNFEYEKANSIYKKIMKDGLGDIYFGWIGAYEESKAHYYIINGPSFLIEFDNNGNPRDRNNSRGNHIHSIFRIKDNDFGEDILKTHYEQEKH